MKTQLFTFKGQFDKELFEAPSGNFENHKPRTGGLWTSTLIGYKKSDWTNFADSEEFYYPYEKAQLNYFAIDISECARVLTIDSVESYQAALEKYGEQVHYECSISSDIFKKTNIRLSYEKMMIDYDAINLTRKGIRDNYYEFHGWDCESTVWFNLNCFKSIKKL